MDFISLKYLRNKKTEKSNLLIQVKQKCNLRKKKISSLK